MKYQKHETYLSLLIVTSNLIVQFVGALYSYLLIYFTFIAVLRKKHDFRPPFFYEIKGEYFV